MTETAVKANAMSTADDLRAKSALVDAKVAFGSLRDQQVGRERGSRLAG